jgi:hypothetical protein
MTHLAVGTPVTWHPPHSLGRSVFPHPGPRLYSYSHKALDSENTRFHFAATATGSLGFDSLKRYMALLYACQV